VGPGGTACSTAIARVEAFNLDLATQVAKPRFVGVLNGVTFYPQSANADYVRQLSPKCATNKVTDAPPELARTSALNFSTTYLPANTVVSAQFATACGDDVISIATDYRAPTGPLAIYRNPGPATQSARFSRDQLEALTLGGRPAVIIEEKHPGGANYTIVMSD
jgi:hypothetical protein